MLIPVGEGISASAVALVEPWACVEDSYAVVERQGLKAGGRMLVVAEAGADKAAFKNLRVYISVPSNLIDVKAEKIDGAVNRLEKGFLTVGDISRNLGAKW